MASTLSLLTSEDLQQLAAALRSGRVAPPINALILRRYIPAGLAESVAEELRRRTEEGAGPRQLADLLETLLQDRRHRLASEDLVDLVWTGPEVEGIVNRDTAVVVREMFRGARETVLVAGYAVYQGRVIFRELAERMDDHPGLDVRLYLDIQRSYHDPSSSAELVRRFAERFRRDEWPGQRLPQVFYDPRSLQLGPGGTRASLHAKCVVVDRELAFVSSANFTEAAQTRNIEVGVLLRSPAFARRLTEHFEALSSRHLLERVPLVTESLTGTCSSGVDLADPDPSGRRTEAPDCSITKTT